MCPAVGEKIVVVVVIWWLVYNYFLAFWPKATLDLDLDFDQAEQFDTQGAVDPHVKVRSMLEIFQYDVITCKDTQLLLCMLSYNS